MTRRQLLALGLGGDAIDYRLTTGELIAVHAGVYAVGHREPGPIPSAAAVVLACGDDAVLSHDSAAALWRIGRWPERLEVSAPRERRRPGIVTHRTSTLTPDDVTVHHGIPITSRFAPSATSPPAAPTSSSSKPSTTPASTPTSAPPRSTSSSFGARA